MSISIRSVYPIMIFLERGFDIHLLQCVLDSFYRAVPSPDHYRTFPGSLKGKNESPVNWEKNNTAEEGQL